MRSGCFLCNSADSFDVSLWFVVAVLLINYIVHVFESKYVVLKRNHCYGIKLFLKTKKIKSHLPVSVHVGRASTDIIQLQVPLLKNLRQSSS